jgi:glycosyltransferase involved in cell wall biosynthesis
VRIAIVSHTSRRAGGVETYLASIAPELRRHGHEVGCWFETDDGPADPLLGNDSDVPSWTVGEDAASWTESLRNWRPDVLYVHGLRSPALESAVLDVAPAIFFAHSYHGTCISGHRLHRFPSDSICTREFGPACLAHYLPRRCGGLSPLTMLRQYNVQRARLEGLHRYRYIAVHAAQMASVYRQHGFENIRVISFPVAPLTGTRTRPGGLPWRLLYLGRFEKTKGADLALASAALAAAELDVPVHLQMSGAGTLERWLHVEAQRAMNRSPRLTVTITGWLDADASHQALEDTNLLLVPSRWPEPFGLVGLEAGTHGVPSIGFDAGGIRDWLTDGLNGRLVAGPPDVARFAGAIVECLRNPDQLLRMGEGARAIAQRFTMQDHLSRLERVLEDACAANTREALVR